MPSRKRHAKFAPSAPFQQSTSAAPDAPPPKRQKAARAVRGATPEAPAPAADGGPVATPPVKPTGKRGAKKPATQQPKQLPTKGTAAPAQAIGKTGQAKGQAAAATKVQDAENRAVKQTEKLRQQEAKRVAAAEAKVAKAATKAAKVVADKAAAAEQRELKRLETAQKKVEAAAARKAAKEGAAEEARQTRRVPPSADGETGTAESMRGVLAAVAERVAADDPDDRDARRALLAPLAAEEPTAELLGFCDYIRGHLHEAYGKATELPSSSWADANLTLRLGAIGPDVRKELSKRWLQLPGVTGGSGSKARLVLYWDAVLQAFKRLNRVKDIPAAPVEEPEAEGSGSDEQVMGVVGGWAVFSLRAMCERGGANVKKLVPLIDAFVVPEGADSMSLRDPAVLYLLARQQFGGLTAITPSARMAFTLAQSVLSSYLTQDSIAQLGVHAFQAGVDAVASDSSVRSAFFSQLLSDVPKDLKVDVVQRLLDKFFHQAGAEFTRQIESIWGSGGGKDGVAVRTELKVLQKTAAKSIEDKCVHLPPAPASVLFAMCCLASRSRL